MDAAAVDSMNQFKWNSLEAAELQCATRQCFYINILKRWKHLSAMLSTVFDLCVYAAVHIYKMR